MEALQETNARLVDTLQELQRERAGDALEGVLAEVDRTISGMLTYVEDLRRTREQLVRGVQSVADRLAEIDTRAVLGSGGSSQPERPADPVSVPTAETTDATAEAETEREFSAAVDIPDILRPEPAQPASAPTAETGAMVEETVQGPGGVESVMRVSPGGPRAAPEPVEEPSPGRVEPAVRREDERAESVLPVDLVVHGCRSFELVGKLQARVLGLAVVQSMRVRRFHRGSLYITVSHRGGDLADEIAGLEIDGKRLRILESGKGRIEATFPG